MGRVLTILEVSQKQNYIFSSKRLRANAERSNEIAYVTGSEFFRESARDLYDERQNLVYAGGGQKPDWFAEHRTELLSDAIRFLDAIPAAEKKAALPAIKGFYENKDESVFETVMKDGSFSPGLKRAKLGGFCAIEGDTLEFWRTATDGVTRILRGKGEAEKTMFQTRYISKGQTFEGYIELDDPGMSEVIGAALPKTLWIGADRYDGFGKCTMVSCEAVNQPAWRETYGYQKQEDLTRELYLLAISPFTMMNAAGDPCGLSTEGLAEMLGVGSVEVSVCSTSTSEYGAYNRAWRSREATVRMYDRGSIFKLCCDTVPNLEKLQKLENKGIGARRAEGFGQILFLKKELFEGIRHKAAAEEKCEKERTNKAAAVRRARYCWVMEQADEVRRSKLSLSQLGTMYSMKDMFISVCLAFCVSAIAILFPAAYRRVTRPEWTSWTFHARYSDMCQRIPAHTGQE